MSLFGRSQGAILTAPPASVPDVLAANNQFVATAPLTRTVGPAAVQVDTTPILMADFTDTPQGGGFVAAANLGPNTIFWCVSDSAKRKPSLSTTNGLPLVSNGVLILDNIGGMALWGVCTVAQVVGADTRVTGAKI